MEKSRCFLLCSKKPCFSLGAYRPKLRSSTLHSNELGKGIKSEFLNRNSQKCSSIVKDMESQVLLWSIVLHPLLYIQYRQYNNVVHHPHGTDETYSLIH